MPEFAARSTALALFGKPDFVHFLAPTVVGFVVFAAFLSMLVTVTLASGVCNVGDVLPLAVVVTAMNGVKRSSTEMGSAQSPVRFCGKGYGDRHGPIFLIFSKSERNGTGFLWHYLFI